MKIINAKKTKFFWAFYVLGILIALLAVMVAPIWSGTDVFFKGWGAKIFDVLIAFSLIYYIVLCLFKRASSARGTIQILTIVEIVILALIALSCLLSYFVTIFTIKEPCMVLGVALWLRGANELLGASISRSVRHPVWKVVVYILFITLGTWLFARPIISRNQFEWVLVASLAILAVYTIIYASVAKPNKKN